MSTTDIASLRSDALNVRAWLGHDCTWVSIIPLEVDDDGVPGGYSVEGYSDDMKTRFASFAIVEWTRRDRDRFFGSVRDGDAAPIAIVAKGEAGVRAVGEWLDGDGPLSGIPDGLVWYHGAAEAAL